MKHDKTAKTEKKFWIAAAVMGVVVFGLAFLYFFQMNKAQVETLLLNTINYVREQCSIYTRYNNASESKSLRRAIESNRLVSINIANKLKSGGELDSDLLKKSIEQLWLDGIILVDAEGNLVCQYSKDSSLFAKMKPYIDKKTVLDSANRDERVYAQRISRNDGSYIDMAASSMKDVPGVVVTYDYTPAIFANDYNLTIQSLLNGYQKLSNGIIIVADKGVIVASNDTNLIGQSTVDQQVLQLLNNHADSKHILHMNIGGVYYYGLILKQRKYYIYMYVPDTITFWTLSQNVITVLFSYLVIVVLLWAILRRSRVISIEKELEIKRKYEKNLMEEAKKAEAANRAKTEFLQRMSHDIRTPINGICGMVDVGEHYSDDLLKQAECRKKIREASGVLLEIINEVLEMSKLEFGEISLEEKPFNLYTVIVEVTDLITNLAEETKILFEKNIDGLVHTHLIGSQIHLKRILINILTNAVKYNKEYGHIYLSCRELPADEPGKIKIEFLCRDTGIGMSEEFQRHLFEPFAQEKQGCTSKFGGTGLGMSIAKSLTEKMGGTLTFESKQGIGTTMIATLLFKIDEYEDKWEVNKDVPKDSIKGFHILLVEDNELNMEIAEFMIQNEGASVTKAWNGQEALERFEQSRTGEYDAILMDVMMPVLNGYEATEKIRALNREDAKKIPIIAMTANAFTEDRRRSKEAGMDGHIIKPINIELLVKVVAELVQ